jgi:hypothetical protein
MKLKINFFMRKMKNGFEEKWCYLEQNQHIHPSYGTFLASYLNPKIARKETGRTSAS